MALLVNDKNVPPAWSLRFNDFFENLKNWIESFAYPALVEGPLKTDPSVTGIHAEIERIEAEIQKQHPIPVALVGLTGVGKSTLLNALLEQEFLPTGVVGSQTAAFVSIRYAPEWEITCEYIEESELNEIFREAVAAVDEKNETGSPEIKESAGKKIRALFVLKDDEPLPPAETLAAGPPKELQEIVRARRRRFLAADAWQEELKLHAKGRYWPITRSIDVRGPFEMLQSGVVISDLPGTGDLNWARANQAAGAVKQAGQILIAADAKLLQASLMEQLEGVGRLPHRLFMDKEPVQIILVGTSLDAKLPDAEEDPSQVRDLALDPAEATQKDVFSAVCTQWRERIRAAFVERMRTKANQFLPELTDEERSATVARIMESVEVVATSALDWRRHQKGKPMKWCRDENETGLPRLRDLINKLAQSQIETTARSLERRVENLRGSVLTAIERSESALGANIQEILDAVQASSESMREVQERRVQIVDDLRLTVLDRFHQIRERIEDKIQNAALRMGELGRKQVELHLDGVHWASLRATVRREGIWQTAAGNQIDLREAMGGEITRLVPQAWSRIVDERLGKEINETKAKLLDALDEFNADLQNIVYPQLSDDLTRSAVKALFDGSRERADARIDRGAQKVTELLGRTSSNMQEQIDEAVQVSLKGVCSDCSVDEGTGWRLRSVTRIIRGTSSVTKETEKRCMDIASHAMNELEESIRKFCQTAVLEMNKIGEDIPKILKDAIEQARLTSPQVQRVALEAARSTVPAPLLSV